MKTLHLGIIVGILIIFLGFGIESAKGDDINSVYIQNIQVQPFTVKVGDAFTITATLVNNATFPIVVDGGKCSGIDAQASFLTIVFDNHAKIKGKDINCAGVGWSLILQPGKNITTTSPDYTENYIATKPGTANATVTFSYHVINQTNPAQPGFSGNISKSILFTILDNDTGIKTSTENISSPLNQNSTALDMAIKLATSSPEFQSMVEGYNYTYTSDFEGLGTLSAGGMGLTAHGFAFELYSGPVQPGKAVRVVEVLEDPSLTKILNVTSYHALYSGPLKISITPNNSTQKNNSIPPPLQQFRSGIKSENVKCPDELILIIKAEDGTPACVKPEHLTRLSQYGWTIPNLKIIGDTDITKNGLSENDCGQFHTIPENKSNSKEIPVLILKQNSTGCAKITFTVNFLFNNTNDCVGCNSQMVKTAEFLSIGKYNFSRHGDLISGSSGRDYTHSFQIISIPKIVDISKYPIGSNFTAVFIIKPLPNATGFYDYSIVKPMCNAYPLVVGYNPDQVNSSDFSEGLSFMQNHPCVMGSYGYSQVQVAGIDYVQMKLD